MGLQIGVIGAGTIGQLRAQSVAMNPDTALVGVADPVQESAERASRAAGARAFTDWRRLLELPGLDAVIVSSPVQNHEEAVVAAVQAGKHVLCEKPLSNSLESCRRIYDAARQAQRVLAVGFNHRFYPSIRYLKRVIDDGRIGKIDHLRVFAGHNGLSNFRADWQYKGELSGGGAMMDAGIHMTDLARYIVGEITDVYGIATNDVWKVPGSEDNAMAIFRSASGIPVRYHATWTEWKGYHFYLEVYGDRGMVRGYYAPMFNLLVTMDRPGGKPKREYKLYPEIIVREKLKGWTSTALETFQHEMKDFVRMLRGEQVTGLADGWSGVRAVEIAEAVYRSSREGVAVRLSAPA